MKNIFLLENKYNAWTILIIVLLVLLFSVFLLKPHWVIGSDGFGYYAYARSMLFDKNLDFYNEYTFFDNLFKTNVIQNWITPIGKIGNQFAVGASILWLPFILLAKLIQNIFSFNNPYALVGYNLPFQILLGLATWFFTLIGIGLVFSSLNNFYSKKISWWSTLIIIGISPLPFYLIYEPSMSHGLTFFSIALIFYVSVLLIKNNIINHKLISYSGLSIGLAFLIRWQDIIFAIIPAFLLIKNAKNNKNISLKKIFKYAFLFLATIIMVILPQLFTWKYLYGSWIAIPQGGSFFDFSNPHLWSFLFSGYHGMFVVHPLLILPIVGLFFAYRKNKYFFILLFLVLIFQIILNSSLYDWYAGGSFGARRMVSSLPILLFGLAALLEKIVNKKFILYTLIAVFIAGIIFNGLLIVSYARGVIPLNEPTTRQEIYLAPFKIF